MGQEVIHSHFSKEEIEEFAKRIKIETQLLEEKLEAGYFSSKKPVGGFEVEAWLVDQSLRPAPINQKFFENFNNPMATHELAKFNIELNIIPLSIQGRCFHQFEHELNSVIKSANCVASDMGANVLITGILPTVKATDFCVENMSEMKRYKALNETVLKARNGKPLSLDIKGKDHLQLTKHSVMLEAATTSFQIHLQTPWQQAHHYYNASIIGSAPLLAVAGNSPFLFGNQLWHETRIPLFEQSVDTGSGAKRVSFGSGYAEKSIAECFEENLRNFPVLLPMIFEDGPDSFSHLRLHNGVIWRWNRPLIGFDVDNTPHIRIEQRILPAGPTIADMIANAVFFYGITQCLMRELEEKSSHNKKISFDQAKDNFYQAAKLGLDATIVWKGKSYSGPQLQTFLLNELLPMAEQGLSDLGLSESSTRDYLEIISSRIETGQTGAVWQVKHLEKVGGNFTQLTKEYLQNQEQGQPVHTWSI